MTASRLTSIFSNSSNRYDQAAEVLKRAQAITRSFLAAHATGFAAHPATQIRRGDP